MTWILLLNNSWSVFFKSQIAAIRGRVLISYCPDNTQWYYTTYSVAQLSNSPHDPLTICWFSGVYVASSTSTAWWSTIAKDKTFLLSTTLSNTSVEVTQGFILQQTFSTIWSMLRHLVQMHQVGLFWGFGTGYRIPILNPVLANSIPPVLL